MIIKFYHNASELNVLSKKLQNELELTGTFRENVSVMDPVFTIQSDMSSLLTNKINYCYIPDLGRYYFIKNMNIVRTGLIEVSCHVDVLKSFENTIRKQEAIIKKQENNWNLYLNDGTLHSYQNPTIIQRAFPNQLNDWNYILKVAGRNS